MGLGDDLIRAASFLDVDKMKQILQSWARDPRILPLATAFDYLCSNIRYSTPDKKIKEAIKLLTDLPFPWDRIQDRNLDILGTWLKDKAETDEYLHQLQRKVVAEKMKREMFGGGPRPKRRMRR